MFYSADTYVIGKAFFDLSSVIQHLKKLRKRIIIDVCDNVFEPPEDRLKEIYESILPLADRIVVSSEELAKVLRNRIDKNITVIPDHLEGPKISPFFNPITDKIKLLWFGYPGNLDLLNNFFPNLSKLSNEKYISWSIVTHWNDYLFDIFKDGRNGIQVKHVGWSLETMGQELFNCDMVIIPSSFTPARITKTANKVITSLYAGRYVVAYPIPSYLEFSSFISLGEDLVEGIKFSLNNPEIVRQRITNGQVFVEKYYSPEIISRLWETVVIDDSIITST
jgi:glycosyltransferase involved in cell wall biosynthesis